MATLSKSRFLSGTQCEKKLFYDIFRTELKPPVTQQKQALFDVGHIIGQLAQTVFPGGLDATEGVEGNWTVAIERTREWIGLGKPTIYEAAFSIPGGYAAMDILHHEDGKRWAIEVKSSSQLKEYYITDASFQYFVMDRAGFKPDKIFIMYVNTNYVKQGLLNPKEFLFLHDITERVLTNQKKVEEEFSRLLNILSDQQEPIKKIGKHCSKPFHCEYIQHCRGELPEKNVFQLHNARGKDLKLHDQGVTSLADIPEDLKLNHRQQVQVDGVRSNKSHLDIEKIKEFLDRMEGPLYFFDFETINPTIPVLNGTSPFQQVPFQYSLHITDKYGKILEHKAFLADPVSFTDPVAADPRWSLIQQMKKEIGPEGNIIAYHASFETGILKKLAKDFPEEQAFLESILPRFIDLLIPFRKAWYYLPTMGGSASIKEVLPAIAPDFSYKDLPINNGGLASETFKSMILGGFSSELEQKRQELLDYCQRDSEGMVIIYRHLIDLTTSHD